MFVSIPKQEVKRLLGKPIWLFVARNESRFFALQMKDAFSTIFITGCLLLIIWGGYGYAKGRLNLRQHVYATEAQQKGVETIEEAKKRVQDSVLNSTVLLIGGAFGIYLVIYHFNKPAKKRRNKIINLKY